MKTWLSSSAIVTLISYCRPVVSWVNKYGDQFNSRRSHLYYDYTVDNFFPFGVNAALIPLGSGFSVWGTPLSTLENDGVTEVTLIMGISDSGVCTLLSLSGSYNKFLVGPTCYLDPLILPSSSVFVSQGCFECGVSPAYLLTAGVGTLATKYNFSLLGNQQECNNDGANLFCIGEEGLVAYSVTDPLNSRSITLRDKFICSYIGACRLAVASNGNAVGICERCDAGTSVCPLGNAPLLIQYDPLQGQIQTLCVAPFDDWDPAGSIAGELSVGLANQLEVIVTQWVKTTISGPIVTCSYGLVFFPVGDMTKSFRVAFPDSSISNIPSTLSCAEFPLSMATSKQNGFYPVILVAARVANASPLSSTVIVHCFTTDGVFRGQFPVHTAMATSPGDMVLMESSLGSAPPTLLVVVKTGSGPGGSGGMDVIELFDLSIMWNGFNFIPPSFPYFSFSPGFEIGNVSMSTTGHIQFTSPHGNGEVYRIIPTSSPMPTPTFRATSSGWLATGSASGSASGIVTSSGSSSSTVTVSATPSSSLPFSPPPSSSLEFLYIAAISVSCGSLLVVAAVVAYFLLIYPRTKNTESAAEGDTVPLLQDVNFKRNFRAQAAQPTDYKG